MAQFGTDGGDLAVPDAEVLRVEVGVHAHPQDDIVEASFLRRIRGVSRARFGKNAADLLPVCEQVVRPLDAGLDPDLPERLRNPDRRRLGDARSETRAEPGTQHEGYPEPALR